MDDGPGENFVLVGTIDNAVAEDGFTISLTLNSDNTWSVSSVGLDAGSGELTGSGTLATGTTYADFAGNLFASSFFQTNTQAADAAATGVDSGAQYTSVTVTGLTAAELLVGDVNLDGTVNFLDISPFISLLSGVGFQDEADINRSGTVDFLDISPFIVLLSGQGS